MICVPCAFLSLPGITLKALSALFRNNFAYSPALESSVRLSSGEALNVMTWNVGLGPAFMSATNGLAHPKERIGAIVEKIVEQEADIVSLQEVFDHEGTQELVKQLNEKGYNCVHSILTGGVTTLSSGLFFAIKRTKDDDLTIKDVKTWKFTNGVDSDWLSNKGLLGLKLKVKRHGAKKNMYVFNTHLQASYGKDGYSHVRKAQMAGIIKRIQEWTVNHTENVLLSGDLNFGAAKVEVGDDDAEYDEQMKTLQAVNLTDDNETVQHETLQAKSKPQGSFMHIKKKDPSGRRSRAIIDYVIRGNGFAQTQPQIIDISQEEPPCSDHSLVVAQVSFISLV